MSVPSVRSTLLVLCVLTASAAPALAQSHDRREAEDRERRRRMEREEEARDQQRAAIRRQVEVRERLLHERAQRERIARQRVEHERAMRRRDGGWRDGDRPRITVGGGLDVRQFGGSDDRYVVHGGVDFRTRSGLGVRPEVLFAWGDAPAQSVGCPIDRLCVDRPPVGLVPTTTGGRSRMLGVAVNGTYTFARSSPVRPYVLSGLGVFSTRSPEIGGIVVQLPGLSAQPAAQVSRRFRNDVDIGLTTGAGLEFDLGPISLFTEFRYLLTDQPRPAGFSGMLPLTVGLRL